ncbi:MAG TPA: hypothetical protein VJ603_03390 [Paucimonas sp.]|nr:hypothetical protein [Paucimonas sp.]HJW54670.1 hypothetical protein [Burkholderiaceae bacterium]
MQRVLVLVLVVAAGFVWLTSGDLPPVVASHFVPGGTANGFMRKGTYMAFMLAVVVAVPALIGFSGQLVRVLPLQLVNLPNKQYWLAPQRSAATLESLSSLSVPFALALAAFLCFVHWLVVQANAVQPARLSEGSLFIGLAAFGVATVLWLLVLFRRFGRVP